MPPVWAPTATLEALRARADCYRIIREFFLAREVLEVSTPVVGRSTVSDVHLDSVGLVDGRYLQTSPEYHMKRLLAAGVPSMYQITPAFRAGETGRRHNGEFTLLEWYRLGYDDRALMVEVAELVDLVLGPGPYVTRAYPDLVASVPDAPPGRGWTAAEIRDWRFERAVSASADRRMFVVDYPAGQAALAQLRDGVAARFELIVDGLELANGYFELGDAVELRARFEADLEQRVRLDRPAVALDAAFLAAMEEGLPRCAGVALGLDRLLMCRLDVDDIAAVISFPDDRA